MEDRKMGFGTFSLILVLLAVIWGIQWGEGVNISGIGVFVLKSIGLGHLVLRSANLPYLFTFFFTIPAFIIGRKYNDQWGAKAGWVLSAVYAGIVLLTFLFYLILK